MKQKACSKGAVEATSGSEQTTLLDWKEQQIAKKDTRV